jgi:hypothetical protein
MSAEERVAEGGRPRGQTGNRGRGRAIERPPGWVVLATTRGSKSLLPRVVPMSTKSVPNPATTKKAVGRTGGPADHEISITSIVFQGLSP